MHRISEGIVFVTVLVVLSMGLVVPTGYQYYESEKTKPMSQGDALSQYQFHYDEMSILSDAQFHQIASQEGWPGSGAPLDPFVITLGWFSGTIGPSLVLENIENTYFVFDSCIFHSYDEQEIVARITNVTRGFFVNCLFAGSVMNSNMTIEGSAILEFEETDFFTNLDVVNCSDSQFVWGNFTFSDVRLLDGTKNITIADYHFVDSHLFIMDSHDNRINDNIFTGEVYDAGWTNNWNGNYWLDYSGLGPYTINGPAGSVDNYPSLYTGSSPVPSGFIYSGSTVIRNDAQFAEVASVRGWTGNGTSDDPFIIERVWFQGTRECALVLENLNTTHFIFELCGFSSESSAVLMNISNVKNGVFLDCLFVGDSGICQIFDSENLFIDECYFGTMCFVWDSSEIWFYGGNFTGGSLVLEGECLWIGISDVLFYVGELYIGSSCHECEIYGNEFWYDAIDDGYENQWSGNYWSEYDGTGDFYVSGNAGSVDTNPHTLTVIASPPNGGGLPFAIQAAFGAMAFVLVTIVLGVFARRVSAGATARYDLAEAEVERVDKPAFEDTRMLSADSVARGEKTRRPEPPSLSRDGPRPPRSVFPGPSPEADTSQGAVKALRGGEFLGNRMRFKVKVLNETRFTITDVTVFLLSHPQSALVLRSDNDVFFPKIEPKGFRSPYFDFSPTQDCVRGEIIAGVSYVDHLGVPHSMTADSYVIRAVCDLLQPEPISAASFELKLKELHHGDLNLRIDDWTPEEMHEKTLRIVDDSNFYEVSSSIVEDDGVVFTKITGWARGKYTGRSIGVEISISGKSGAKGASCRILVLGEDEAMILPTVDELKEKLSAWLCPMCGSKLSLKDVERLRDGEVVECQFCKVAVGR
jgi:hypothetical protein